MQRLELVAHDPAWAMEFAREAPRVRAALGETCVAVHHIGSTAVPGIRAKPIIDMLAVVCDLARTDDGNTCMVELGYECMGEFGIAGRRYFRKDTAGVRTHHVHAFEVGSPQAERHLRFRDYLRAHPDWAAEYEAVKLLAARRHPEDVSAYTDEKSDVIRKIDALAAEWNAEPTRL